jgi:hypothetical protein
MVWLGLVWCLTVTPPPPLWMKAVHLKLKRMCTICGVTVTALAVHMNAVHTGRESSLKTCSVSDPDWIRIHSGQWIRIRFWDSGGQNDPQKYKN